MKVDVKKVARLANLELKPEEEEAKFENQISNILEYVEKINSADVKDVEPTSQVTGLESIAAEDDPELSLTQKAALSGTKNTQDGYFKVKAILENG